MPLGYILRKEEVLAYYGLERNDIAEALFKYGGDRKVTMTTEPGTLGGGGGQPIQGDAGGGGAVGRG